VIARPFLGILDHRVGLHDKRPVGRLRQQQFARRLETLRHWEWDRERLRNCTTFPYENQYSLPSKASSECSISLSFPSLLIHAPEGNCLAA
jgi:hypothetical protein